MQKSSCVQLLNILQGLGRSGSHDWGELDVFFAGLKGKLSSSSVEAVITSLKEEEVRDMHVQEGRGGEGRGGEGRGGEGRGGEGKRKRRRREGGEQ